MKFIYFWLFWVFIAAHSLSLVTVLGASRFSGFSYGRAQASIVGTPGLNNCDSRALERRLRSCGTGLSVPRHVGSFQIKDRTGVPCVANCILNHWTTREALTFNYLQCFLRPEAGTLILPPISDPKQLPTASTVRAHFPLCYNVQLFPEE